MIVTGLALGLTNIVVVVHVTHPRDEGAYLEYLRLYGRGEQTGTADSDFADAPTTLPAIPAHKPHYVFTSAQPD